jgi:hypothetical protein
MFTMVESSTTISWAIATTTRTASADQRARAGWQAQPG